MLNQDVKTRTLESIVSAYQALDFYLKQKEENTIEEDFVHTAFGLVESCISNVAKDFELVSIIKNQTEERSRENRERNKRIQELEKEIANNSDFSKYKENIIKIEETISKTWKEKGFSITTNFHLTDYGNIQIELGTEPITECWDLLDEEDYEAKFEERRKIYDTHEFLTIDEGKYKHVIDNDRNKEKLLMMISETFPGAEITKFMSYKNRGMFYINRIEVSFSNLLFMEGK